MDEQLEVDELIKRVYNSKKESMRVNLVWGEEG